MKKIPKKNEAENKSEDICGKSLAEKTSKSVSEENSDTSLKETDKEVFQVSENKDFAEKIKESVKGLYYISETDAEFSVFIGEKTDSVSKEEILRQTINPPDANVEEKDFTEFFDNLTKIQDWFEKKEIENAKKFGELEKLLRKNLIEKSVFKIGEVELEIYIVGLDAESVLSGVKTEAAET